MNIQVVIHPIVKWDLAKISTDIIIAIIQYMLYLRAAWMDGLHTIYYPGAVDDTT